MKASVVFRRTESVDHPKSHPKLEEHTTLSPVEDYRTMKKTVRDRLMAYDLGARCSSVQVAYDPCGSVIRGRKQELVGLRSICFVGISFRASGAGQFFGRSGGTLSLQFS